ncbi:MAG: hypothetical protein Q4D28_04540, partial [Prevotellaceae bacterium]|nr:hypothetical protein [Prevotellaceae bacterium]
SLTRQTPVSTNIVAAQDSEVYLCSVSVLQNLLDEVPMLRTSLADALFHQAYLQYLEMLMSVCVFSYNFAPYSEAV